MSDDETRPEPALAAVPEPEAEKSPYLTRAKMLPVEGVVYCLEHGAVHDDTTDPYGYGEPDCTVKEHRPVYYRGRKGDLDETGDVGEWMADVVGGVTRESTNKIADEAREAAEGTDEPPHPRIISASSTGALSTDERILVLQLISRERNKARTALGELREIIGVGDLTEPSKTLGLLTSSYDKISDA